MIPVTINGEETIEVSATFITNHCGELVLMDPNTANVVMVALVVIGVILAPIIWTKVLS